ncbi:hypothetical protein [Streptosporangium sp. NPDC051022]|uniref:hypothetical protein n=1 Tax=Streptosporangium sp. NPDC051022 TaxID=3155752 RepID=UPI00343EB0EE
MEASQVKGNPRQPEAPMRITFLGKDPDSDKDDCPSLYDTDRNTYLVQGWRTETVVEPGQTCVEVPRRLMVRMVNSSQLEAPDDERPVEITLTDRDTYLIRGKAVVDAEALAAMSIPAHEDVVEVPLALRSAVRKEYAGVLES